MFADRIDAGRQLAREVGHLAGEDVVVLGLPRGGVPVAAQVADALNAPLDVAVVRKLGAPFHPELAMGAIGEHGARVINEDVVRAGRIREEDLATAESAERAELARRARAYRQGGEPVSVAGRTAVIVDDGIATGATARAACRSARARGAARVVLAVAVAPPDWRERIGGDADELLCPHTPAAFSAVGQFYRDFEQVTDEEVVRCLARGERREVGIPVGGRRLDGVLTLPPRTAGLVVFAHGSGSSRHSPRNRFVAEALHAAHLGTLLFDLLTEQESLSRANVFDVGLLAGRLTEATDWLTGSAPGSPGLDAGLPVGYFGASTGSAAALWAAAEPGSRIAAVVSRGGRPDLAGPRLAGLRAPTLFIVGGADLQVLELNRAARQSLRCPNELREVPGAGHLFEEPGALSEVAELARDWFLRHLAGDRGGTPG